MYPACSIVIIRCFSMKLSMNIKRVNPSALTSMNGTAIPLTIARAV